MIDRLAIQSWCFRGFKSHQQVIDALFACGLKNLEISNAHVNPTAQTAEELAGVLAIYRKAGVNITSTGLFYVVPEEAKSRRVFDFVRLCGVVAFTAGVEKGCFEQAQKLAHEYGVRLAIHNHGRLHRHGPAWALEDVLVSTSEGVGLCLDTAWMLDSGNDPVAFAAKHAGASTACTSRTSSSTARQALRRSGRAGQPEAPRVPGRPAEGRLPGLPHAGIRGRRERPRARDEAVRGGRPPGVGGSSRLSGMGILPMRRRGVSPLLFFLFFFF